MSQIIFSVFGECLVSWWWWVYCPPRYKRILGSVWRATDCLLQQMNLHQPVSRRNSQHDHVQNMMWIMTVADLVRLWAAFWCWTIAGGVVRSVAEFLLEITIIFSHVSVLLDKISTSAAADLVILAQLSLLWWLQEGVGSLELFQSLKLIGIETIIVERRAAGLESSWQLWQLDQLSTACSFHGS